MGIKEMFEKSQEQLQQQQVEENNSAALAHCTDIACRYWYDYTLSNKVSTKRAEDAFEKGMKLYNTITPKSKAHAEFISTLVNYYLDHQQYLKAKELIDELINTCLEVYNTDSNEIINTYLIVSKIYTHIEEYSTALKYCFQGLLISERVKGKNDIWSGHIYGNMGDLLMWLQNNREALVYLYKRLEVVENLSEQNLELLSNSLNDISVCHSYLNEFELAIQYSTRSLELDIKLYGAMHSIIAGHYTFRTTLFYNLERYDESYECCTKALKIFKDLVRPDYTLYARCYRYMGLIELLIRDNYNSAYKYYKKGLKIVKQSSKDKNDEILEFYNVLGALYRWSHNYTKALTYFEEAYKMALELYDPESETVTNYQAVIELCKTEINKDKKR